MSYDVKVSTVLDETASPASVEWRIELWSFGEFIAGVTHHDLGKAFRDAYLIALQDKVTE